VTGRAREAELAARVGDDGRDDPERRLGARERRPLLHVELDVRAGEGRVLHAPPAPVTAGFLVAEDDHAERSLGPAHRTDRLEPGDHAESAVELASLGHGVEMRAGPDLGQLRLFAHQPANHVPPLVPLDLETGVLHP
jgi:hypothetical protein